MAGAIVPAKMQPIRGGRRMFTMSDDSAMTKQIQATHAPDGRDFEVRPLLNVIEDIMRRATPTVRGIISENQGKMPDSVDDKALQLGDSEMFEVLAFTISKTSCEISCKCSGGGDAHATTMTVFNTLSNYSWEAKAVITLAAFSVNYGEFWLVAQLYPTNALAKSVALLKQLPDILERADTLKPKFEALTSLIDAMLQVTKCIVEFKELPPLYVSPDMPEMLTATSLIPTAVYWIIRSVVACASQIMNLMGMGHGYISSTTEAWELSSLAHKVSNINSHLKKLLAVCYQYIDERKHIEAYQNFVRLIDSAPHIDNMKIITCLIYLTDDQPPLFDGSAKRRVSLEVLRKKNVLLFISDLDVSQEELGILQAMYTESRQNQARPESQFEVLWLPVVEKSTPWSDTKQKQFEALQNSMPWHSLHHPFMLEPAVTKYIKEVWRFNKKPLLVVLDPHGKVVNPNGIHMMLIWGSLAFPFTSAREEELWKDETWTLEFLAEGIEPEIHAWVSEGKYICLYGGEDMEWIRSFTRSARNVAQQANISLEMLYVGNSNPRDKVRKNNAAIMAERLSHTLQDLSLIRFFWMRLESMWHSKVQHGRTVENDPIMPEIMTMLSFDGSDRGWAVFSRASAEMAKAQAESISRVLAEFEEWKDRAAEIGFVLALDEHLHKLHTPHHCNRLILPGTTGRIPERVVCAECGRPMEKFIMYRCCTD